MLGFSRRDFFGVTAAGLATTTALAADPLGPATWDLFSRHATQASTLHLTWQRDPTTTMTVQWVGVPNATDDTNVYYLPLQALPIFPWAVKKALPRTYHPNSDLKVFRAELTGLKPGTEYQFKVGKNSPIYRFRTMPEKNTNGIQFISGGDAGVNSHVVNNNIQAARQDPAFALIGGDLAYENGTSLKTHLAFLRNYSQHMITRSRRLIPMLALLGNHEVDGGYDKSRSKAPFFYALFDGLFPERGFATLDFGDYLSLILLDTGHTTPIRGEQTAWLEKVLKEREDHPHVMVANHVPAYPTHRKMVESNGKPGTGAQNRQYWVPLFDRYRVPVVLEHHDHTFKRTKPLLNGMAHDNGVLYLGDGSWGKIRAPIAPEKMPILLKTSQDYHLTLHRLEGDERFHLALDEYGRVMDVARSGQRRANIHAVPAPRLSGAAATNS